MINTVKAIDYLGVKRSKQQTLESYAFWMQKHQNSPSVYQICIEILEQASYTISVLEDNSKMKNIFEAIEIGNSLGSTPSISQLEDFSSAIRKALVEINENIY